MAACAAQAQVEAIVNSGIKFSDIFEEPAAKVAANETCPEGFTSINAGQAGANRECLKLKVRHLTPPCRIIVHMF